MTGKDLILFIINNDLICEEFGEADETMIGKDIILSIINNDLIYEEFGIDPDNKGMFISAEEAAIKLGISTSSLLDMARLGVVDSVDVDGEKYFYKNIDLLSVRKERV